MKNSYLKFLSLFLVLLFTSTNILFAQQLLEGDNKYNIVLPDINPGGDFLVNERDNYEILATLGQAIKDPRTYSESYLSESEGATFEPNTPTVSCFETTTDGSSECQTGPTYLNEFGMTRVCGPYGCYDRGRFEIDTQNNPTDTLYGIQISTDGFENDIRYIDGNTFTPKDERDINDYKTKEEWETDTFNLLGLQSNTEYFLRITALYGDLSESVPGPSATAETDLSTLSFRIGLGYENGANINYNPPYEILFDESFQITRGANIISSDRLIWTLINTNSVSGITVVQRGEHGGLYSSGEEYTINSLSGNLNNAQEGIGLRNNDTWQLYDASTTQGSLGQLTAVNEYDDENEYIVGIIDTIFKRTYESDGPIHSGETGLSIKTKASLTTPKGEYFEDITFVLIAKY